MLKKWQNELFGNWTAFEKMYISLLLLLQVIVFYFNPDSLISMIAGISGVLCVTFAAKGKISNYIFGFIQIMLYLIISIQFVLYGEVLLNVFYFIMQIVGFWVWRRNMTVSRDEEVKIVKAKALTVKQWGWMILSVIIAWYLFGTLLKVIGSNSPYLDSMTTALSVVAQVLMTLRFREQWVLWIIVNLFSIVLWIVAGNASMVAMWVAFLFNSTYGYMNWIRLSKCTLESE
ncbi:nicotinamide riboside transporter PnuC [Listeria costaricensis]|uniref:nicotinamide riboside transporter PnuC n=1 Tax=Listeria costaricensis TaxID=2026604 RepID=UPI000C082B91|nr:nicotinamide riboside transporter PnuC [Listeria costaricensis]